MALLIGAALTCAVVVALVGFTGSYQHQYELDIRYGQAHWVAGMQPVSVEGLIAAATLLLWFAALIGRPRRLIWPAYLVLLAGIGQAALMNVASDPAGGHTWPWLGPEIAIWPAVAFLASYEMAVWMIRNRPVTVNQGQPVPPTPAPPTPAPESCFEILEDGSGSYEPELEPYPDMPEAVYPAPLPLATRMPDRPVMADEALVQVPALIVPEYQPMPDRLANGTSRRTHTCNDGAGPRGGRKTPGCPRCDDLLAGARPAGK